jgi:hypothetical protein
MSDFCEVDCPVSVSGVDKTGGGEVDLKDEGDIEEDDGDE